MSVRAWTLFAAVSTLWGIPYLFIKIGVDGGVPPAVLAWARLVLGAGVLLALAARSGALSALKGRWRFIIAYGIVEVTIPFPLIATGERYVASSLAAIIIASVPLIVAVLAVRFDHAERATGGRLAGLIIGLFGVVLLVGLDASGSAKSLLGAGAILIAAVGYAGGPLILKRNLTDIDPRAAMGASLAIGVVALTPLAILDAPSKMPTAGGIASVVVLGLVCTALAFVLMAMLIAEIGASRAVVITYINPIVAVALGVTLLGEKPGAGGIAGLLLILAGSWLSTDGRLPPGLDTRLHRLRRPRSVEAGPQAAGPCAGTPSGASVGPEVLDHLAVAALGAIVADGDQLEPVGPTFERARDAWRHANQIPQLNVLDLVIEPDAAGA
jgi:drug/metabolite transporter (DMT)-like permease